MIDLENNTVDLDLFKNIIREIKENPNLSKEITDSYSFNQFKSKSKLIHMLGRTGAFDKNPEVTIFGSWFASILIPALANKCREVTAIDLDDKVVKVAKNRFFKEYTNVDFITDDVFGKYRGRFSTTDVFINTSCEHMKPMKEWPYWDHVKKGAFFAFQSNNMFHIEDHVNCVHSIDAFLDQLPNNFTVLDTAEIQDERGTRFTIVGDIS
jgi:hypothetical protein